ncbi:peptidoglycan/xylan/chitin deacetylase (PgdA/CDA1 family) [Nocardioides thalensis]|uniref:Peptidoglycan/xylan/chitin deacetylase (PgdA/CDA1 family) n=1 Tax=Nocardioides thalensis TaxID=1914755 RepID=A0A853C6F6_9ACTN|nr:polysaccharide deacetylase family protein [Nocardioides thalensis]NYJ03640.1 peptidoglycan/xylan/chitin deacetylase (PgdA/CDA1 family) [Nocardioides thalensis]
MHADVFDYSPIIEREPVQWPGDAKVAVYIGLNIEHFHVDRPSTSLVEATAGLVPDALNYGWRDYGARVGIWRVIEILDRYGVRASALINSEVCEQYPQIVAAGRDRDWAWLAHGRTNSSIHANLGPEEERAELLEISETIHKATGQQPRGWMGPALTETFQTPALLEELGYGYTLDWTNDDQPYRLKHADVLSIPYSVELNDLGIFSLKGQTGREFEQMVIDHLNQLMTDVPTGRVMGLALHPFIIGQPARAKYLDRALHYITSQTGVWLTTSDQIESHFRETAAT